MHSMTDRLAAGEEIDQMTHQFTERGGDTGQQYTKLIKYPRIFTKR